MAKRHFNGLDAHQAAFVKALLKVAVHRRAADVFSDFCELTAISFSNATDRLHFEVREARYGEIVSGYNRAQVKLFAHMLAHLVESLSGGMKDSLGEIFQALELHSVWHGQYFTPYSVARMVGEMTAPESADDLPECGFISVCEPCAGAGAMVIGFADAMLGRQLNYQRCLHVTAVDIDALAAYMAYVQFSLLHLPAIVVHGDSLQLDEWSHWVTPAHVLGFWDFRLSRAARRATVKVPTIDKAAGPFVSAEEVARRRDDVVIQRIDASLQFDLFGEGAL